MLQTRVGPHLLKSSNLQKTLSFLEKHFLPGTNNFLLVLSGPRRRSNPRLQGFPTTLVVWAQVVEVLWDPTRILINFWKLLRCPKVHGRVSLKVLLSLWLQSKTRIIFLRFVSTALKVKSLLHNGNLACTLRNLVQKIHFFLSPLFRVLGSMRESPESRSGGVISTRAAMKLPMSVLMDLMNCMAARFLTTLLVLSQVIVLLVSSPFRNIF